jgi:S-adenosyl-L-methionine hydrolase (adenosine-forming)
VSYDWVSLTTDYGLEDGFVAACVGVIARIAPAARIIHVTHAVPPRDIRRGGTVLAQTVPFLPPAVHLAVVDPGVGTVRRPIALVTPNGVLVGPDNGLLLPAADALGGVLTVYELSEPRYRLPVVSATFHGRDIFAPAAAHLAAGLSPHRLGPSTHPDTLVRLRPPRTVEEQGKLITEVLTVDRFGNLQLAVREADLSPAWIAHIYDKYRLTPPMVRIADHEIIIGRTFADAPPGAPVVYFDSAGHLAIALNGGSAADFLGLTAGATVVLTTIR